MPKINKKQIMELMRDWYVGTYIIGIGIFTYLFYYLQPDIQASVQQTLPYNTIFNIAVAFMIIHGVISCSNGIAKLVMKNRYIVSWLIRQKEKQDMRKWRNGKNGF